MGSAAKPAVPEKRAVSPSMTSGEMNALWWQLGFKPVQHRIPLQMFSVCCENAKLSKHGLRGRWIEHPDEWVGTCLQQIWIEKNAFSNSSRIPSNTRVDRWSWERYPTKIRNAPILFKPWFFLVTDLFWFNTWFVHYKHKNSDFFIFLLSSK